VGTSVLAWPQKNTNKISWLQLSATHFL